jgi:sulfhydrogenase subunit gamma (sulfur reductase)
MELKNSYIPYQMRIANITEEAPLVKTFRLEFVEERDAQSFRFKAGQFAEYGVFGEGESTFCIASPPTREGYIECTFRSSGRVTNALANCELNDVIGLRGPYGNTFPIEEWVGKNIVFITGGIGLPPLRCVIWNLLDQREKYGDITIYYGARTTKDLVYKEELEEWKNRGDVNLFVTVDPGGESPEWKGLVGFVPTIVEQNAPKSKNAVAIVAGPPILIKMSMPILAKNGFENDKIYTTLENRMKCGVGKCGHCTCGNTYVCKDGPVFTYEAVLKMPAEY